MRFGDCAQPGGSQIERFIPTDPLPTWVGIALRPRVLEGTEQPVRVVDKLRRCAPLCAERLAGVVRRSGLEGYEPAVFDDGNRAAPRDAHGAVRGNALGRLLVCWRRDASFLDGQPMSIFSCSKVSYQSLMQT